MKSITKNSIFYLIYTALNVIFPFVTGVYVSHILLETYIGEAEAAKNIAQYFVILAYLGIPTYGLREIAKARNNKEELNKVFSELAVINFISTAVFLGIYFILILSVPAYRSNLPLYIVTGGSIALNFLNISWLYEGLEEFSFICIRNLIFKVLCFILLVIFVRKNDDYMMYAALTVIGLGGNYILNVFKAPKFVKLQLKNLNLKRHLKSIFFLVVVNLAIEIYTMVDITMLKFLANNESIAFYSYGSKIYKIFIYVLNAFTMVVVPRLSFLYKEKNYSRFNQLLTKTLTIILLLAIPMIIGVYFTSDYLLTAIYGQSYIKSAQVMKILSIIFAISPVGYLLGSRVMLVSGNENKMIIPVAIGAVINVICNYFLIKSYQEIGAAIASVISEFVVAFIYIAIAKKYYKLDSFFMNFVKIIIASLFMTGVLVVLMNNNEPVTLVKTIKEILLGSFSYFTMLFVFNERTVKEYTGVLINRIIG